MSSPATTYWLGGATMKFKSMEEGRESVDYIHDQVWMGCLNTSCQSQIDH